MTKATVAPWTTAHLRLLLQIFLCIGASLSFEVTHSEAPADFDAVRRAAAAETALAEGRREAAARSHPRFWSSSASAEDPEVLRRRRACQERFQRVDFAEAGFKSEWMSQQNLSAYIQCLYKTRTVWRHRDKQVIAGGVHYPTLLTLHHTSPPVSNSAAQWCWLDERGIGPSGLTKKACCDLKQGPQGLQACWNEHFTYNLCCLGDVGGGKDLPHFFVAPAFDINVGNAVRQVGTFDLGQSYALQTLCKSGDVVLDIGANIGGFTVPLAERVGPTGEVHAFEPFRKMFQHLNANVALNGLTNVFTHNVALGSAEKIVPAHAPDFANWNFPSAVRVEEQIPIESSVAEANLRYEQRREKLRVRPLDSFEFGGPVRLVKIDVEFMELEVVRGGRQLFLRDRPVLWVENEPYFDDPPDRSFINFMEGELGYQCRAVARLELICVPGAYAEGQAQGEAGLPAGFHRVFQHLSGGLKDLQLWKALHEVDVASG
eukprot:TRINITY_DN11340_c2_g1_i1.p1 TRINITY_DN11340_c2_g1~~TRINITY_DN11340_c2_g1_i1.p1  ORF type:complete len:488 (-),score=114.06 TRINITY_DN11340_c2_g1_i1:43-1506(-)